MNPITIVYLNGTKEPQYLFVKTLRHMFKKLGPAESATIVIHLASDQGVFVKTWGERVFIGSADLLKK